MLYKMASAQIEQPGFLHHIPTIKSPAILSDSIFIKNDSCKPPFTINLKKINRDVLSNKKSYVEHDLNLSDSYPVNTNNVSMVGLNSINNIASDDVVNCKSVDGNLAISSDKDKDVALIQKDNHNDLLNNSLLSQDKHVDGLNNCEGDIAKQDDSIHRTRYKCGALVGKYKNAKLLLSFPKIPYYKRRTKEEQAKIMKKKKKKVCVKSMISKYTNNPHNEVIKINLSDMITNETVKKSKCIKSKNCNANKTTKNLKKYDYIDNPNTNIIKCNLNGNFSSDSLNGSLNDPNESVVNNCKGSPIVVSINKCSKVIKDPCKSGSPKKDTPKVKKCLFKIKVDSLCHIKTTKSGKCSRVNSRTSAVRKLKLKQKPLIDKIKTTNRVLFGKAKLLTFCEEQKCIITNTLPRQQDADMDDFDLYEESVKKATLLFNNQNTSIKQTNELNGDIQSGPKHIPVKVKSVQHISKEKDDKIINNSAKLEVNTSPCKFLNYNTSNHERSSNKYTLLHQNKTDLNLSFERENISNVIAGDFIEIDVIIDSVN